MNKLLISVGGGIGFRFLAYLKCVCNAWKNAIIHLSSKMNGVEDELPSPDFAAPDKSNSRRHGKPRYGSSCGPRNTLLSAKKT